MLGSFGVSGLSGKTETKCPVPAFVEAISSGSLCSPSSIAIVAAIEANL
jgi:hypothetical protein